MNFINKTLYILKNWREFKEYLKIYLLNYNNASFTYLNYSILFYSFYLHLFLLHIYLPQHTLLFFLDCYHYFGRLSWSSISFLFFFTWFTITFLWIFSWCTTIHLFISWFVTVFLFSLFWFFHVVFISYTWSAVWFYSKLEVVNSYGLTKSFKNPKHLTRSDILIRC